MYIDLDIRVIIYVRLNFVKVKITGYFKFFLIYKYVIKK
jgi:hypothetical protein